jgi:hypothetical protein
VSLADMPVKPPKLPYAPVKGDKRFWQPTPEMRAAGFLPKPLGQDGPAAWAEADRLYRAWLAAKAKQARVTDYPPGSFGAYYDRFRRTKAWARKAPRTREDYERAWKHLEPAFARKMLTAISAADVEDLQEDLERRVSANERHRTIKVLRALFADAIVRLKLTMPSPALAVRNPQPRGRSAIWLGAEIDHLVATADAEGYPAMALAIRIAWETLFSPVDVWTLARDRIKRDSEGVYLERTRTKTERQAYGSLSPATAEALARYIEGLGFELLPDTQVLRQRNGSAYRSKDTFGDDFRAVRQVAFPGDKRQFLDIRRSGNVEADAAGADKATMAELLANSLADSRFLEETYTPATVAKAREVARQRETGRERLAAEIKRVSGRC